MSGQTDNQQGKTGESLKHWFGGFFDGEGTVFVGRSLYKRKWETFSPRIAINNTDVAFLPIAEAALQAFDLPYHVYWSEHRRSSKHAPRWIITIAGWKRCLRASQALLDYLHGAKRDQCEDMIELCHSRLQQTGAISGAHNPYTERQTLLIGRLRGRHTHWNPDPSSTTC